VNPVPGLQRLSLTTRCALASLGVVLALGAGVVTVVGDLVQREAVAEATRTGELAAGFVRHTLPADAYDRPLHAEEEHHLDELVAAAPDLRGLRIWGRDGEVLYDSDGRLGGRRLVPGRLLRGAYAGQVGAQVERDRDGEGPAGGDGGALLEVFVPMRAAADSPVVGAVEVHLQHDASVMGARSLARSVTGLVVAGLLALWGLLWSSALLVNRALRRRASEQHGLARTDELTGLPNRRALLAGLDAAFTARTPVALLLLDLDRFKEVNDTLGHHVGDELLRLVGARLTDAVRSTGTVVRLGGDEFAVLLPDVTEHTVAAAVSDRLVAALEQPFALDELVLGIGTSVGVALAPADASTPAELLQRADVAMYVAKARAGGTAVYDESQDAHSPDRLALLSELRTGLASGELWLAYQPIWDLQTTGACVGVEALLRWDSPRRGAVPPSDFVPLCEHSSLVRDLTRFVLDEALRQCREWEDAGTVLNLAVNLSASNFGEPDLPELIAALLAKHRLPASRVVLEITESAVIPDPEGAATVLRRLVDLGLEVALDDFGTGWSSMSRLLQLPLAALKVDRSFVADLPDGSGAAVVQATTGLGHDLGLFVVAEGLETVEQLRRVVEIGCDVGQGYLLSRPLRPADIPEASRRNLHEWLPAPEVPHQSSPPVRQR
jgi:diguanylate cyclase (GGDEF)-like protein